MGSRHIASMVVIHNTEKTFVFSVHWASNLLALILGTVLRTNTHYSKAALQTGDRHSHNFKKKSQLIFFYDDL